MKKLYDLLLRLLAVLGLCRPQAVPRIPDFVPAPAPAVGATMFHLPIVFPLGPGPLGPGPLGPKGSTGPSLGATGPTGYTGSTGVAGAPGADVLIPLKEEDRVSATIMIDKGLLIEFSSWSYGYRSGDSISVVSKIGISLLAKAQRQLISEVSASSANSRASSIPWVASVIESKLLELKIKHAPLDLDALEEASKKAMRAAMERSLSVFAHYVVERIDKERAVELWSEAVVRHVMES